MCWVFSALCLCLCETQGLVNMVCAKVALAKVIWSYGVELGGEHRHIRILVNNPPGSSRGAEQVDQDDVLLRNLVLPQHLHCFADFVARAHDWVEQEHLSVGNVIWELCINHMFLVGVTVRVNQDLSNPQGATTVLECFFHCFPGPKTHRGYSNTQEKTFEGV